MTVAQSTVAVTEKKLLKPASIDQLLLGWLIHAHRGRDRHDIAARVYESRRSLFGVLAVALSAAVGTSVVASVGTDSAPAWARAIVGLLSVAAAVLGSLQTYLDYAGRAERHRRAAGNYKAVIRQIEELLAGRRTGADISVQLLDEIRRRLDTLEDEMPVVPPGVHAQVQDNYRVVSFVEEATALYR
jgi:hypothetical protein